MPGPTEIIKSILLYGFGLQILMITLPLWLPVMLVYAQIYYIIKALISIARKYEFTVLEYITIILIVIMVAKIISIVKGWQ